MIDEDASARIKDVTKLFIAKSINLSILIAKWIRQLIFNWLGNEKLIITFKSVFLLYTKAPFGYYHNIQGKLFLMLNIYLRIFIL